MKRAKLVILALLAVLLPAAVSSPAAASYQRPEATYTVEYTNLTEAQYLTPPNFAAHNSSVSIFDRWSPASPGLQAVAENGQVPVLAAELEAAIDARGNGTSGVGAASNGPIAPGQTVTFEFTSSESRLSLASMLVCTNDGFAGLDSRYLPFRDGQTRTYRLQAFDAGTEINTELRADLVPAPFCGDGPGSEESNPALAEDGVVRRHRTIRHIGDLDPALDWSGPVAELKVTRHDPTPSYSITIENLTSGQYLTPPNFAVHSPSVHVFERGEDASHEIQQLAENGNVGLLASALTSAIDDEGVGVSGVAPADGPIGPGGSVTFTVESDERRLSFASMLVCTNDGFAGIDGRRLPRWSGDTKTFYVRALDAGTEINTEIRADLVPAPFCGEGPGSTETNPDLAEDGKIRRHRTLKGIGDLDPSLDWQGPVVKVTVTRN